MVLLRGYSFSARLPTTNSYTLALLTLTFLNGSLPSLWHGYLGEFGLFLPFLVSLLSIACALFILYVTVPRARNERVIVCESGLFQNKNKRVEVMRWNEILAINEETVAYKLIRQGGAALLLDKFYNDIDDLIAQIKQKDKEEDNGAGVQEDYRTKKKTICSLW